jgi:hypothetical protein
VTTAILTTVHSRGDTRIRVKEAASLKRALDEDIALYVQDGKGEGECGKTRVRVVDTGAPSQGRLRRMLLGGMGMYRAVRWARPRIAHFHDPELIPVGILLKLNGARVVYDIHEDVPRQILSKHWIPAWLRRPVSWAAAGVEWVAARAFDGIVAATPTIARRFPAHKTVTVQNFPILDELVTPESVPYAQRPHHFAYVGGITPIRGSREMVRAIARLADDSARLQLAGGFSPAGHGHELAAEAGWARVDFHGWAGRPEVARLLGSVRAGLVLFLPLPNHVDAQPNKMFEYMAAGLPVIASDFPLWREIVDGAACGLLVDPDRPEAIAEAMQWILDHPDEAEAMGQRGRKAVEERYNWENEAEKLVRFYRELLAK